MEEAGPAEKIGVRSILADPAVRLVMIITFFIMLGFGIIAPILPLYARSFGVGYEAAGLLISSYAFTRLLFDPVAGPIVDRWGERAAATVGLLVVGVTSVATGLAPNFLLAVVFRGLGGAGSSVLFAALYSYMLKVVPKHRMARTLGVFYGSFNVGFIAGGPIGGLVAKFLGLRSPLFVYAGLEPNTQFLRGVVPLDAAGHIPTDISMRTERPGLFAAGDIRQGAARQAVSSAGDGATAAIAAYQYVRSRVWTSS
jgi:MFS family permease